jgi:hypothetical protein
MLAIVVEGSLYSDSKYQSLLLWLLISTISGQTNYKDESCALSSGANRAAHDLCITMSACRSATCDCANLAFERRDPCRTWMESGDRRYDPVHVWMVCGVESCAGRC